MCGWRSRGAPDRCRWGRSGEGTCSRGTAREGKKRVHPKNETDRRPGSLEAAASGGRWRGGAAGARPGGGNCALLAGGAARSRAALCVSAALRVCSRANIWQRQPEVRGVGQRGCPALRRAASLGSPPLPSVCDSGLSGDADHATQMQAEHLCGVRPWQPGCRCCRRFSRQGWAPPHSPRRRRAAPATDPPVSRRASKRGAFDHALLVLPAPPTRLGFRQLLRKGARSAYPATGRINTCQTSGPYSTTLHGPPAPFSSLSPPQDRHEVSCRRPRTATDANHGSSIHSHGHDQRPGQHGHPGEPAGPLRTRACPTSAAATAPHPTAARAGARSVPWSTSRAPQWRASGTVQVRGGWGGGAQCCASWHCSSSANPRRMRGDAKSEPRTAARCCPAPPLQLPCAC